MLRHMGLEDKRLVLYYIKIRLPRNTNKPRENTFERAKVQTMIIHGLNGIDRPYRGMFPLRNYTTISLLAQQEISAQVNLYSG